MKFRFYPLAIIACYFFLQIPARSLAQNSNDRPPELQLVCNANLETKIKAIIDRPEWKRSSWGVAIETLNSRQVLYRFNSDRYFIPASNTKLFSAATILLNLGADFRIDTSFQGKFVSNEDRSKLTSLKVLGKGDPTLTLEKLKAVAKQLKDRGINKIGELIIDASYLPNSQINDSWEWGDIYFDYGVSPHSFILEENTVNLTLTPQKIDRSVKFQWSDRLAGKQWQVKNYTKTVAKGQPNTISIAANFGSAVLEIRGELSIDSEPDIWGMAIPNPSQYFLASWRRILSEAGIEVDRAKIITETELKIDKEAREIARLQSPNVGELLIKINGDSNNLVAETLLAILEKESKKDKFETIEKTLTELGVDRSTYKLQDASGLSRQNFIAPEASIALLRQLHSNKIYHQSLAVAATSGTLSKRFVDTPVKGLLFAKTGTLRGTATLSGYLEIPDREPIVFSIFLNNSTAETAKMRESIDAIILAVYEDTVNCK